MSCRATAADRAVTFGYKVQRKLRRELRKRFMPAVVRGDLRAMRRELANGEPRGLLLDYVRLVSRRWPEPLDDWLDAGERRALVSKADDAAAHRFDLLGSGLVDAGDPIDWHRDLKTGHRWPEAAHHLTIEWDAVPAGTDIKMPWELSRCQHLVTLGLAWRVTEAPAYHEAFKAQVRDWIRSNPCGYGVNWVCAMDVAIRAVNWLTALACFRDAVEQDGDRGFAGEMAESLWLHGSHIMRNLEWQGPRSPSLANHFLADVCGLLGLGVVFRGTGRGRRWLRFARGWLETEVRRQVFEDGANFETSTSYHRLSFEMFAWAAGIMEAVGEPPSGAYRERLGRMADFVSAYSSPSGKAAQFGDNDGGRFLTSGIGDPADHRYLARRCCGFGARVNRLLLGGWPEDPAGSVPSRFPQGGYAFATVADGWIGVRGGEVSHGGAHAHADQLHFVLAVAGRDVIVDPGTGVYSADVGKRNAYRSAAAHNGPVLNGGESNRFPPGMAGLFRMADDTRTEVTCWRTDPAAAEFAARHHGFARERAGCVCERTLVLRPGELTVSDRITQLHEGDRVEWSLRLAPEVAVSVRPGGAVLRIDGIEVELDSESVVESESSVFSPSYGVEVPASALVIRREVERGGELRQRLVLRWAAS